MAVVFVTELGLTAVIVGKKGSVSWFYQSASDRYRLRTARKQYKKNRYTTSTQGEAVTTFQQHICEEDLWRKLIIPFF